MVVIDENGHAQLASLRHARPPHRCVFEHVYFARPDSSLDGRSRLPRPASAWGAGSPASSPSRPTSSSRCPTRASRPPSATRARAASLTSMGLIRSHYVGRTFIEPQQSIRHFGVKLKLSPVREVARGQARRRRRRLDRPRHHLAQDRQDDPRRRAPPKCTCASARRRPVALLLRHRHADARASSSPRRTRPRRSRATSRPTRSATSRSTACTMVNGVRPEGQVPGGFCDACFSNQYPITIQTPARLRQLRLISA